MSENTKKKFWKHVLFSKALEGKSRSQQIAYIGVMTAFNIIINVAESKLPDNQFSLTISVAVLTGIILGALFGFTAGFLGDFIGFIFNPRSFYMPWVGLSTGMFAFISGLIFNGFPSRKWSIWIKLVLVSFTTLVVCTIGINSTGFYFYNKAIGFSTALVEYISERFGGGVSFWGYVIYRLFFKGQIWNSVFNYALLFITVPTLSRIKIAKK
ncbi:MAG: ECF transporter S component [Clostridia bacterium]|nr:ECF transporter S component [Clostridia bacterium]